MKGILILLVLCFCSGFVFAQDSPIKHKEASPVVIEAEGTIIDTTAGTNYFPSTGNGYFLMAALISTQDACEVTIGASKPALTNAVKIVPVFVLASDPIVVHAGGYPLYYTKADEGINFTTDTGTELNVTLYGFEYTE